MSVSDTIVEMTQTSTLIGGRFRLSELIGKGSVSEVYAAVDTATDRLVAVKLGPADHDQLESIRSRFDREAAALSVVASAHVVELISAGTTETGRAYLVLEHLHGRNLQEVLDDTGPLKPIEVAEWLGQAASALELAHGLGIVHRDLKPANLFLHGAPGARPILKVLDFGMVIDVTGPTERGRDAFGGTPMYMAPEQVRGQLTRIGPATDVWALAMVAVTLLTGEAYWSGTTMASLMREIQSSAVTPPSERWPWMPPAFDKWFERSTRRVPERRFHDVAEQAAQLYMALSGVAAPDRSSAAAAIASASTISARTPTPSIVQITGQGRSVVGRTIECAELETAIAPGGLVTLAGTAGIGKTCLAELVVATIGDRFPDGAWFVPLAPREGASPIATCIAAAAGVEPDNTMPVFDSVAAHFAAHQTLFVLDGAEQVAGCSDEIDRLRRACPQASWLVTSRLPLDLEGECLMGVEPLDLPSAADVDSITPGEALTFSAVELLVDRARASDPLFSVTPDNVADVVAICRIVDGFPLGIELAAAQLAGSSPAHVRAELAARHHATSLDRPDQTTSVRSAVAWSYGLLAPGDQAVLRHLAVFPAGLEFVHVRRLLGHLVDVPASCVMRLAQSRLVSWTGDDHPRLVMLDTVRELCRGESVEQGEQDALWDVARRHAEFIADEQTASAASRDEWLRMVDREHDNVIAVLTYFLDHTPAVAMRLAGKLAWYWYLRGQYSDGAARIELAIARSGDTGSDDLIRALHGAGRLALLGCRYRRARTVLERARDLAHAAGDLRGEANAVTLLGSVARELGEYDAARSLHGRGLELWHRIGDNRETARARNYLVFAAWLGDPRGDPGDVERAWWQHAGEIELRALDDPEVVVWHLLNRGAIAHYSGDDAAREHLERAFAESTTTRFHEGVAWALNLAGLASLERGEWLQARAQLAAALRVHRRLGDQWRCASVLEALAAVDVIDDNAARGALYLGVADALRDKLSAPVPGCERALVARTRRRGEDAIGPAFSQNIGRGRAMSLDEAIGLTRDGL